MNTILLHTTIDSLVLKSPFLNASGPLGWFYESHTIIDYQHLGAFILKGLTKHRRKGKSGRRLQILPQGIKNAIGLENPGIDAFLRYNYPTIKDISNNSQVFIANINGIQFEEYEHIAKKLDTIHSIQGIEINLSCPNIEKGGIHFISDYTTIKKIVQAVRYSTNKTLIAKIPYIENKKDLRNIVKIIQDNGINSISAINTISTESPTFSQIQKKYAIKRSIQGGLSGSYIKDYALETIKTIRSYSSIPIIGTGGISNFNDVLCFLKAGAHAIAIGTTALYNHRIFTTLFHTTLTYMEKNKLSNIEDLYTFARTML